MNLKTEAPRSIINFDDYLLTWLEAFLVDRKARGMAKGTITFYQKKLGVFSDYCEGQAVKRVTQITPALIREYILYLEQTGHNPGGIHAYYRALKTFLFWWEDEVEPEGWKNPIRKVKAPRVPTEPIKGVTPDTLTQLMNTCRRGTFMDDRDVAIFLCLFDTGARASEFLSLNLEDVDLAQGDVLVRSGKGRKPRTVYLGRRSRKALRKYLKHRADRSPALWVTHPRYCSYRLDYSGLKMILKRRAKKANVVKPSAHDFRRGFALFMLRSGTDILH